MEKSTGDEVLRKAPDVTDSAAVAVFVEAVEACFGGGDICITKSGEPASNFFKSTKPENWRSAADGGLVRRLL